jgi:flagellum-specific peptidoglycan hydrolase FlgJ
VELKILESLVESAKDVYEDNEIMQQLVVAQAIHESGFGLPSGGSMLARKYNNLFGIKVLKDRPDDYVELPTWEHINGRSIPVRAKFAIFKDHTDCFLQHGKMMNWPRYRNVLNSKSVEEACMRIRDSGWATDPVYATKLMNIYTKYVKPYYT